MMIRYGVVEEKVAETKDIQPLVPKTPCEEESSPPAVETTSPQITETDK